MLARKRSPSFKELPLNIVGGDTFGRYPKISITRTFNMVVSDNWLVDYAGYKFATLLNPNGKGRAIYNSTLLGRLVAVVNDTVYLISTNLFFTSIGKLNTTSGDVFIAEDNQGNLMLCDKAALYVYNPTASINTVTKLTTQAVDFLPGYIAFHDTRFVSVDLSTSQWRLSDPLATHFNRFFPNDAQHVGQFQTKPDRPLAAFPFPGKQSLLFIIGGVVTQLWNDTGRPLFPYQLQTGFNIDYGTLNADTVANLDTIVCWLGTNGVSGPVILASVGDAITKLSTDGIDFKLSTLGSPQDAHGFMFKQDGHIFYQLTFPTDNYTLVYDFNTKLFFTITDTYLNYHPAHSIAFFNNTYYFVSLNDGNLYEMSTNDTTYNGQEIPRIRACDTIRTEDTSPFVVNNLGFPMEQGFDSPAINPFYYPLEEISTETFVPITTENNAILVTERNYYSSAGLPGNGGLLPAVDLAVSYDGGYTYSSFDRMQLNPLGNRRNRFIYYNLGWCNEFTPQFRFVGKGRVVCGNGTVSIYQ